MDEEGYIQFVSNYGEWQAVKKLKITEKMDPRTVMEFLASLNTGIDNKVEVNLKKIVNLSAVDKAVAEEVSKGKTESDIAKAIAVVNSTKITKLINEEIEKLTQLQEGERKEVKEFCKVYALRKAMKTLELAIDYSQIQIPGMKRVMKGGKKEG